MFFTPVFVFIVPLPPVNFLHVSTITAPLNTKVTVINLSIFCNIWPSGGMGWHAAPLATHAGQAIEWPAGFFALDAFGIIGQVAFLKMMRSRLARVTQCLGRVVRSFFYAIRNGKLLARVMNKVVTNCQLKSLLMTYLTLRTTSCIPRKQLRLLLQI